MFLLLLLLCYEFGQRERKKISVVTDLGLVAVIDDGGWSKME